MKVQKSDGKTNPMSQTREKVEFEKIYTDLDAELITLGSVPESMDDKWFVYSKDGWVYLHRSWTGDCIFMLKLDGCSAGVRITEAWVEKDQSKFNNTDMAISVSIIESILDGVITRNAIKQKT